MANSTPLSASDHSNATREELIDILSTGQKVSLAIPYIIIEPLALGLNFLALLIIWKQEKYARKASKNPLCQRMLRSQLRTYYFLRHLVFSDLLTCFIAIPFDALEIYRLEFRRSHQYCAVSKYVRFVAMGTSFYILVVTIFERFWSLTFAFRRLSDKTVVYMIRGAWFLAFVINVPFFFLYHSRVEYMSDNHQYYVRVCIAEPETKGQIARAYLGVTLIIPAIAIAVFSVIIMYRVLQIEKSFKAQSPKDEDSDADPLKAEARRVALLSSYITASFWFCVSPAGFYYLIIAGIGRPEFPTSYLIGRCVVIIANASAAVNAGVTILCFKPIRDRAKRYLGLGTKDSYDTFNGVSNQTITGETNTAQLLAVKVRSSFRKMRYVLKGGSLAKKDDEEAGTAKTDETAKVSSEELTVTEETISSTIESTSNECRSNIVQSTEL